MTLARLSLLITAAAFLFFGGWLLIVPAALSAVDIQLPTGSAVTEARAMYGGFEIGLGIFFLMAQARPSWHRPALWCQVLAIGLLGATRAVSALMVADPKPLLFGLVALELGAALLGVAALRRLPREPHAF